MNKCEKAGISFLVKMCEDGLKNGTLSDELKRWYDNYTSEQKRLEEEKKKYDAEKERMNGLISRRDKYTAFNFHSYYNSVWFRSGSYRGDNSPFIVLRGYAPTNKIFDSYKCWEEWEKKFINGDVSDEDIKVLSGIEGRKMWLKHIGLLDAAMTIPDKERFVMYAYYYESLESSNSFLGEWKYGFIDLLTGSGIYPGGIHKTNLFEKCKPIYDANDNKEDEGRFKAIKSEFNFFHLNKYDFIKIPFECFENGSYEKFISENPGDGKDIFQHHADLMTKYGYIPLEEKIIV